MSKTLRCSGCGASIKPASRQCSYCGSWIQRPSAAPQAEKRLPAWTQGIASGGYSDGSYDTVDYPAMPLSQALQLVERLPIPPRVDDPGSYCPPALGFGERNVSRMEDGRYFLWPEDRPCTLEDAIQWVQLVFGAV